MTTTVLFALDFDGVLVDSAAETGHAGWKAAKILWPENADNASWLVPSQLDAMIERFRVVRPCLETGWEACLIIRLLADPAYGQPSNDDILQHFQDVYKERLLKDLHLTPELCNQALKEARNNWIAQNNGQDWIQAHDFFHGACQAVRQLLTTHGNENIFVITTKAKDFAIRLLEQQELYAKDDDANKIKLDHIYGLGSGPKATVLAELLSKSTDSVAVMVEDNLLTLQKIVAKPELKGRVLPALASWGYNTPEQRERAAQDNFVILNDKDSSSISRVLDSRVVPELVQEFDTKYYHKR